MYKAIYVPVDNSEHSDAAMRLSVALGKAWGARLIGSHVYAAKLHDVRFKQMEFTLPDEYKEETELEKQRRIHDALIARGLQLISESYLDVMKALCEKAEVEFEGRYIDGRTFEELVKELDGGDYDLVVLGALGQGAVKQSAAGSVCERTLRRAAVDTLVVRDADINDLDGAGDIVVAMDGSTHAWGALQRGLELAQSLGRGVEVVSAIAPDDDAADLVEAHLSRARKAARAFEGVKVRTTVLEGSPLQAFCEHIEQAKPWLVVAGRSGADAPSTDAPEAALRVGSFAERLIRHADGNTLVTTAQWSPAAAAEADRAA